MSLKVLHTGSYSTPVRIISDVVITVRGCDQEENDSNRNCVTAPPVPPPPPPPPYVSCLNATQDSGFLYNAVNLQYTLKSCISSDASLHVELTTNRLYGWIGLGFHNSVLPSDTANNMDGATVFVADLDPSGSVPFINVGVGSGRKIIYGQDNNLRASLFEYSFISGTHRLQFEVTGQFPKIATLIWCMGLPGTSLHDLQGVYNYNFESGIIMSKSRVPHSKIISHSVFMSIAWMILAPLGVLLMPETRKTPEEEAGLGSRSTTNELQFKKSMFKVHLVLGLAVAALTIVGFFLIYSFVENEEMMEDHFTKTHGKLGLVIFLFILLHVVLALARPAKDQKLIRKSWSLFHKVLGSTMLILGVVDTFYGLKTIKEYTSVDLEAWRIGLAIYACVVGGVLLIKLGTRLQKQKRNSNGVFRADEIEIHETANQKFITNQLALSS